MMKFEKFETEPKPEKTEQKTEIGFRRKIERLARNAVIWGMVSVAGILAVKGFKEERAYKDYQEKTKKEDLIKYEELKKELIKKISEKGIKNIEFGDREAFFNREKERKCPTIANFEKAGLDSSTLKKIWTENEMYPKNWINGEVESIRYVSADKMPKIKHYGEELKGQRAGGLKPRFLEQIIVTVNEDELKALQKRDLADSLDFRTSHEFAHSNDWETDNDLSLAERAELLNEILKRIESNKPFRSIMLEFIGEKSYHQKIKLKDAQEEKLLKAKEYWAEICEEYFNLPERLQKEYPDDFALVDKYVKKNDPNFNPFLAKSKRQSILHTKYGLSEAEKLEQTLKNH